MLKLHGIFPPMVTPFVNQEFSYTHLAENIKKWNAFDLSGYVLLGSNGESVMMTETESLQLIETAVKYVPDGLRIIIGAGRESTRTTLEFIRQVHRIGGDAALIVPPHYYKSQMTGKILEKYFLEVAEHSPLPLIIYNVPKFTGLDVPPETVARLGEHNNIIGIKDSSGNMTYLQSIIHLDLKEFQVLAGSASTLVPALIMGAVGGILAFANFAPQLCIDIYRLVLEGRVEEARLLQLRIICLNQLTTAICGIGGLKFTMDQVGLFGGEPRRPLLLPDNPAKKEIMIELKKLALLP